MEKLFKKLHGKILRLWHKNGQEGEDCDFVFLIDYFEMPDKRVFLEFKSFDERYPNKQYPSSVLLFRRRNNCLHRRGSRRSLTKIKNYVILIV